MPSTGSISALISESLQLSSISLGCQMNLDAIVCKEFTGEMNMEFFDHWALRKTEDPHNSPVTVSCNLPVIFPSFGCIFLHFNALFSGKKPPSIES